MAAKVTVLLVGYSRDEHGETFADGTITLIQSEKNIVVDTGVIGDEKTILQGLEKASLSPEDVDIVVHTHGDPDHVGNDSLFVNATVIGLGTVNKGPVFTFFEDTYRIDTDVWVKKTPGHSELDITGFVTTKDGVVAACHVTRRPRNQ